MKKQYLPYYISRALISTALAVFIVGFNWKTFILTIVFFSFFLIYLHSGWFNIDSENMLAPIRRDSRGQQIQRRALIIALVSGLITYFSLSFVSNLLGLELISGNVAFAIAVITYFVSQFVLFKKA